MARGDYYYSLLQGRHCRLKICALLGGGCLERVILFLEDLRPHDTGQIMHGFG